MAGALALMLAFKIVQNNIHTNYWNLLRAA
jgi:hypothetical protein